MPRFKLQVTCLDCSKPNCKHVKTLRINKPLGYAQKRLLSSIEANPGMSRAEHAAMLYTGMNAYYSVPKVSRIVKTLELRGLVYFDTIREESRAGAPGVYRVGQPRPVKPGYLGVNGWVYPKGKRA